MTTSLNHDVEKPLLSRSEFIAGFHAIGEERYHHKHPFHLLMHEGKLTRGQLQAWALNRYYYQSRIPIKDAAILARSEDPAFRLGKTRRVIIHINNTNPVLNEESPEHRAVREAGWEIAYDGMEFNL